MPRCVNRRKIANPFFSAHFRMCRAGIFAQMWCFLSALLCWCHRQSKKVKWFSFETLSKCSQIDRANIVQVWKEISFLFHFADDTNIAAQSKNLFFAHFFYAAMFRPSAKRQSKMISFWNFQTLLSHVLCSYPESCKRKSYYLFTLSLIPR